MDDGISGAEFTRRPGFVRLMNALQPRPPFQVLIMSEESRLGREAIETAYALKQIIAAGVRVFFYLEDRERTLDSPIEKVMLAIQTMADEMERKKARQRMVDTMMRKAKAGHVTGGQCFGYDNVPIVDAAGVRSHVDQCPNETEAAVVRRIFELAASGQGVATIAKTLNTEGAPAPRSQQDRPRAWVQSSVHSVLHRRRYVGLLVWNQTRKRDRLGQRHQTDRDQTDWITAPRRTCASSPTSCGPPRTRKSKDAASARISGRARRTRDICCPGSRAMPGATEGCTSGSGSEATATISTCTPVRRTSTAARVSAGIWSSSRWPRSTQRSSVESQTSSPLASSTRFSHVCVRTARA